MTALEVLQQAKSRIEKGWTQGWFARDIYDNRVSIGSEHACKFCLSGALWDGTSTGQDYCSSFMQARAVLLRCLKPGYNDIIDFNDDKYTTREDVLELVNRAIVMAENGQ